MVRASGYVLFVLLLDSPYTYGINASRLVGMYVRSPVIQQAIGANTLQMPRA